MSLFNANHEPWTINAEQYAALASDEQRIRFILQYGILAPSTFNAQPWACHIDRQTITIYLDTSRLPVKSDKTGRFGIISLGCFIENICLAANHFGWEAKADYQPSDKQKQYQLVATVLLIKKATAPANNELFNAITTRATNRSQRSSKPIPTELMRTAEKLVLPNVEVAWLDSSAQQKLIDMSKEADFAIWSDKDFRLEHVTWVRSNWTRKDDGMPGYGVGVGNLASLLARPIILSQKFASIQAKKNKQSLLHTTSFFVLASQDTVADWLDIGRSYQRLGLLFTSNGIATAPMGQYIEHQPTRIKLKKLLNSQPPQIFCRAGYPTQQVRHSPRRSVDKILI